MLPASESISQELAVNFFHRETWAQERINVWKVQGTPPASVQVGQTIWFHSNIFVMGGDFGKYVEAVREGQLTGRYRYEGEILHIVGWQRHWVRFGVGCQGVEAFHLLVPIRWTVLGLLPRALHALQRHHLLGGTPPLLEAAGSIFDVSVVFPTMRRS